MAKSKNVGLDVPGAGLPSSERFVMEMALKFSSVMMSDAKASALFLSESQKLLAIAHNLDIHQLSQPMLVPRLRGIEDSSRHWSVLMILDHLCLVNRTILETLDLLNKNMEPQFDAKIEDFKPDPDVDISIMNRFQDMSEVYVDQIKRLSPLGRRASYYHPWFGILNSHQWHCLAAYHMRIHRKQAHKITTLQGLA